MQCGKSNHLDFIHKLWARRNH